MEGKQVTSQESCTSERLAKHLSEIVLASTDPPKWHLPRYRVLQIPIGGSGCDQIVLAPSPYIAICSDHLLSGWAGRSSSLDRAPGFEIPDSQSATNRHHYSPSFFAFAHARAGG